MEYRSRKDGSHFPLSGKGVSRDTMANLAAADAVRKQKVLEKSPESYRMSYGDAKPNEVRAMVRKYTEFGSKEKGYRPHTIENVDIKELKKIPTSFLDVAYERAADKSDPRAIAVGLELERRNVYKKGYTMKQVPEHMRPMGLSPETMAYYKGVLRQMAERNKAFSKDLTGHARDYGIT